MTAPITPQAPSPTSAQTERDRQQKDQLPHGQTSKSGQDQNKSGRPGDDRDPNSPSRGSQRPIDPNATNKMNDEGGSQMKGDARNSQETQDDDSMETGSTIPGDKGRNKPL